MDNRQKQFIAAALFFVAVIITALIIIQHNDTAPQESQTESGTPSAVSFEESHGSISSAGSDESSYVPAVSEVSALLPESSDDAGDESSASSEGSSEENSSEVSVTSEVSEGDLPYYPPDLIKLTPANIMPSELDSYFKDSLFVGNSIAVDFSIYCSAQKQKDKNFLGGARFFSTYGFSAYIDLHGDSKYFPRYKGEALHTWEAVEKTGAKTVYFCLMGLTELWKYPYNKTPEKTFESNRQVIEKIKERCPDVKIVVLSASYMVESFNSSKRALNNYLISRFNSLALEWCNENGCDFIDVSTPFLVGDDMPDKYCRDPGEKGQGIHIKNDYYSAWAGTLRNYAYLKQRGAWKNPKEMRILKAH